MHHRFFPPRHRTTFALLTAFTLLALGTQTTQAADHFCGQRTALCRHRFTVRA